MGSLELGLDSMADENSSAEEWFCLRSQPKHEHIAAARLRQDGFEAFSPRIRFKRSTRRGPVWVTEALFPSYLFAKFNRLHSARQVHHSHGILGIVHFGDKWPVIPEQAILDLRNAVGEEELRVVDDSMKPGDEVTLSGGAFHGLEAVVAQVKPAQERVRVLLEFLGRQTATEVGIRQIVKKKGDRKAIL